MDCWAGSRANRTTKLQPVQHATSGEGGTVARWALASSCCRMAQRLEGALSQSSQAPGEISYLQRLGQGICSAAFSAEFFEECRSGGGISGTSQGGDLARKEHCLPAGMHASFLTGTV